MILVMSALGALALTSGIALAAAQPYDAGDNDQPDVIPATAVALAGRHVQHIDGRISAAGREHAYAVTRERFERR